ncbi:MAG TPA: PDZ domain-containing protein [Pyrinomonadaceae bacterium]|nr:PDZ domain-containing protein [Pyrinomonadaceae bacterium]
MAGYGAGAYAGSDELPTVTLPPPAKKKRRFSGMSWIFVGLLIFFVAAAAFTAIVAPKRNSVNFGVPQAPVVRSYIGVDEFSNTDEGVIFEAVTAPGGPADKAGLVGGDVIVSVDGQQIHDEDQLDELMTRTPIGKSIDIEYMRDGQKKTAKLMTISLDEHKRLIKELDRRPEGRGVFGYEDGDAETVKVPGMSIHGVKLNRIYRNQPADMAGVKDGDIVIEMDGIPIRTSEEFLMRVRRALPYTTVKLVVMRPKVEPQVEGEAQPEGEAQQFEKVEIPVRMGKR